jgi:hypothetical protein
MGTQGTKWDVMSCYVPGIGDVKGREIYRSRPFVLPHYSFRFDPQPIQFVRWVLDQIAATASLICTFRPASRVTPRHPLH